MNSLMVLASILLQSDDELAGLLGGGMALFISCCSFIVAIIFVAGMWKTFAKAGQPGWAAIVPFYNIYVMLEIVGRETWWLILFFIPFVNFVAGIIVMIDVAKSFGKSAAWGIVMLLLLGGIGWLVLGFGDAEYQGPANKLV